VADSHLGKILVNSQGQTLYLFKADVGMKSACTGACARAWPPLLATGNPTAGSGANPSLLGTTKRADGASQVTYNGHPLYLFIKDKKPGQTNGQGVVAFGAAWLVLSPAGNQIPSHPRKASKSSASQPAPAPPTTTTPPPAPAPPPATTPAPKPAAPPAAKPNPPAASGIPQNGGGDDDGDNHGAPSDGDGNI
jgi:predicted lipoprotein with Yx(FWY)xxD motif